jgi:hypothetical protein
MTRPNSLGFVRPDDAWCAGDADDGECGGQGWKTNGVGNTAPEVLNELCEEHGHGIDLSIA